MKLCQGPECHTHKTKDRIRGTKGNKYYATRRRSQMYYGKGNFCSLNCLNNWLHKNIEHALDHFGRITEPKKVMCDDAWYKSYAWQPNGRSVHFFNNDLLGEKRPITEQQYNDQNYTLNSS